MSGTFSNVRVSSNVYRKQRDPIGQDIKGRPIEIAFPVGNIKGLDNANKPLN